MIDYDVLNKARKKYLPFYILSLIFGIVYFSFIIFHLIKSSPKDNLIYYIVYTTLSFFGIIGAVSITTQLISWYEEKILSLLKPMYLAKMLHTKYGLSFRRSTNLNLNESKLIASHHKYHTKLILEGSDFSLIDVSMLSGMRLNGYALVSNKIVASDLPNYIITNYKYYYRHHPKGYFRNKQVVKPFFHKCKLFQDMKHTFSDSDLNAILPLLANFKNIGISRINGRNYVLFSLREKDGINLFVPSILEKINSNYETVLNANLNRVIKLLQINLQ